MKKSTVVISLILLVMVCWFSILLVACKKQGIITTPGDDKPVEKIMEPVPFDDSALKQEIADLKAQLSALQSENDQLKAEQGRSAAQQKDIYAQNSRLADENKMLAAENGQLRSAQKDIDAQNSRLADENKVFQNQNEDLRKQIAALMDENNRLNQSLAENKAAKKDTEAGSAQTVASADSPESADGSKRTDETKAADVRSSSQVRNVLGFKIGPDILDIEATLAILPHWFLIVNAGMVETPVDFVEDKFPGYTSNHNIFSGKYNYLFDVMGGMGFNWQFNSLPAQPNLYLSTMIGPTWFMYKEDGDLTFKRYLLWRTSLGFDLTIYKDLLFTTDIGFDWMKDYDFTPRLAVGFLWRYSRNWSLFGGKK